MNSTKGRVGFIGAGNMGRPMIGHLVAAGYPVSAFARRDEVRKAIEALGAVAVDSPAAAAAEAAFVLTNVTSTGDVEDVLFGQDGAVATARSGAVCIDFSTISPLAVADIARRVAQHGLAFLDAPVSGGTKGVEAATLSIMVGGDAEVLERARPLLLCLGKSITHVGPSGAGQVAKACNQLIQVINIQGIAEAMLMATHLQVDPGRVLQAISTGMAGSRMLDLMGPKMVERDFKAGIEARLHAKDFGLVCDVKARLGIPMPATEAVHKQLQMLVDAGLGYEDTASLLRVLENQADQCGVAVFDPSRL